MARHKSPFSVDEKPLNVSVPVSLHDELDLFLRAGEGNQRPKKLLVGAAIHWITKLNETELNTILREYRKAHFAPDATGGKSAAITA